MIGHIVAEERFLHQNSEHHLFVTAMEGAKNEFRFEVRHVPPGRMEPETVFEKTLDFSNLLAQCPNTTIDQLIEAEIDEIRHDVFAEEDIHAHDP